MSEKDIAGPTISMADAMIISEMEKFRSFSLEKVKDPYIKDAVEGLVKEMILLASLMREIRLGLVKEMILLASLMREIRLEDGSCRLRCLIYEIVEMADVTRHLIEVGDYDNDQIAFIMLLFSDTNKRLLERSQENDGVGDGDGDVVGFEEDVKLLLREISNQKQQHNFVACIRGIAGYGKTTLARQLYLHADVVHEFDRRVWESCREFLSEKSCS